MAVYNHLQLLCYYAKPNNFISGTIVKTDVTRMGNIWMWHGAEHILVSGRYNFLNGHIESAVLREFARYEDMWTEVSGVALPDTEQESRTNVEGSRTGSSSAPSYTSTTTVNIGGTGGGGGASYLDELQDVNTEGVMAQSVLYYNGTEWVDRPVSQLLNGYAKEDDCIKKEAPVQTIKGNLIIDGNLFVSRETASRGSAQSIVTVLGAVTIDMESIKTHDGKSDVAQSTMDMHGLTQDVVGNMLLGRYTKVICDKSFYAVYSYEVTKWNSTIRVYIHLGDGSFTSENFELTYNGSTWSVLYNEI